MHTQEKAPTSGASNALSAANHNELSPASQSLRLLEYLQQHGTITTLDARRMGIMHPGMRVCELRKRNQPIDTIRTYQADETGAVHWVAAYIWRGENSRQGDLWEGC